MSNIRVHTIRYHAGDFASKLSGRLSMDDLGLYWMICTQIYLHGGPIDNDPSWLSRLFAGVNARSVKSALDRLISSGYVEQVSGKLSVNRCETELKESAKRIDSAAKRGAKGGRPSSKINDLEKAKLLDKQNLTNNQEPTTNIKKERTSLREGASLPSNQIDLLPAEETTMQKRVFDLGVSILGAKARGMIAKLRKHLGYDDQKALDLLMAAKDKSAPAEWLGACLAKTADSIVIPRRFVPKEENPTCWGYMVKGHGCDERFAHIPTHQLDDDDDDQRREGFRRVNAPGAYE